MHDQSPGKSHTVSWFKAMRSADAMELIRKNPKAYALAAIIACRARWHDGFNADGLEQGEAMLGDYGEYGMTRQEYRTALNQLRKWNFATTRTTNEGTIARLTDTRLFDPLNVADNHQNNHQAITGQPPTNHQATTNEEGNKGKIGKKGIEDGLGAPVLSQGEEITEAMEQCVKVLGAKEMNLNHRRWFNRAEADAGKLIRVLNDTATTARENGLKNPAAWAETLWNKVFQ